MQLLTQLNWIRTISYNGKKIYNFLLKRHLLAVFAAVDAGSKRAGLSRSPAPPASSAHSQLLSPFYYRTAFSSNFPPLQTLRISSSSHTLTNTHMTDTKSSHSLSHRARKSVKMCSGAPTRCFQRAVTVFPLH